MFCDTHLSEKRKSSRQKVTDLNNIKYYVWSFHLILMQINTIHIKYNAKLDQITDPNDFAASTLASVHMKTCGENPKFVIKC